MFKAYPNVLTAAGTLLPGDVIRFTGTGTEDTSPVKHSEVISSVPVGKAYRDVTLKEFLGETWTGRERTIRLHHEFVVRLIGTYNKAVQS